MGYICYITIVSLQSDSPGLIKMGWLGWQDRPAKRGIHNGWLRHARWDLRREANTLEEMDIAIAQAVPGLKDYKNKCVQRYGDNIHYTDVVPFSYDTLLMTETKLAIITICPTP